MMRHDALATQGRVLPNATGVVCDTVNDPGSCVNFTALASPSPSSAPTPVPIAANAETSGELDGVSISNLTALLPASTLRHDSDSFAVAQHTSSAHAIASVSNPQRSRDWQLHALSFAPLILMHRVYDCRCAAQHGRLAVAQPEHQPEPEPEHQPEPEP